MRKIAILTALVISITGCSSSNKKLDNATALRILQENFEQFCKNETDSYISTVYDGSGFNAMESYYNDLKKLGLVTVKKSTYKNGNISIQIGHTKKAESEYGAGSGWSSFTAAMTKLVPKEIVGISYQEDGNKAIVQFMGDWERTPFYNIQHSKNRCNEEKGTSMRATFIRFDTGWHLE